MKNTIWFAEAVAEALLSKVYRRLDQIDSRLSDIERKIDYLTQMEIKEMSVLDDFKAEMDGLRDDVTNIVGIDTSAAETLHRLADMIGEQGANATDLNQLKQQVADFRTALHGSADDLSAAIAAVPAAEPPPEPPPQG